MLFIIIPTLNDNTLSQCVYLMTLDVDTDYENNRKLVN